MSMVDITGFQRHRRAQAEAAAEAERTAAEQKPMTEDDTSDFLSESEINEMMRNKANVMAALRENEVNFSDRSGVEELRQLLTEALTAKGLLPNANI